MARPTIIKKKFSYSAVISFSLLLFVLCGCARWTADRGVENSWRKEDVPVWKPGVTTETQVVKTLGPPSSIISLKNYTVFYYMREHQQGNGFILIIYNNVKNDVRYDRAVFFFDNKGILSSYSYSNEELPYAGNE